MSNVTTLVLRVTGARGCDARAVMGVIASNS